MESRVVYAKVFPSSKKEKVLTDGKNSFEVYIREPAQRNLANQRTRECIAEHYKIPVEHVSIQTGHRARKKSFIIKE
ncbi:DUF167 domain-containing protein [Candidatus Kaiserbacteria bacterium]|nr:MAG: DUF167 domain-containing protein [Candidatus Kaiserbacteria bacterium]